MLSNRSYSGHNSSKNTLPNMTESDPCIHGDGKYSFIDVSQLQKCGFNKVDQGQQSNIHKKLKNFAAFGVHLILFVTHKGSLTPTTCTDLEYLSSKICDKQVPVICVILGCENDRVIDNWQCKNQKMLSAYRNINIKRILGIKNADNWSDSMGKLWQVIEEYSMIPSIVVNDDQLTYSTRAQSYGLAKGLPPSNAKAVRAGMQKSPAEDGKVGVHTKFR